MDREQLYRIESRFREVIDDLQPEYLIVRETAPGEFIIAFKHPHRDTEYALAPTRRPKEARIFTVFGNAVRIAVRISGIKKMEFDLIEEAETPDDKG